MVVSDHGHSPVDRHEDLDGVVRDLGHRTVAHPWVYSVRAPEVAVMVSGNAMAHLYLEPEHRAAPGWPALAARWGGLRDALMARESVDLALFPSGAGRCRVAGRGRGEADVEHDVARGLFAYRPVSGDPLSLGGEVDWCDEREAYARSAATDYPDALVQIAHLAASSRVGDVVLSASRGWDFRSRYEPIPHRSSHGALHREHMLVPFLCNRSGARAPRRTADVMPTALAALGIPAPERLDGESFL
jgi:arylsulfatase A-like enzyme